MAKPTFTFPYKYKTITEGKILDPLIVLPMKTKLGWYPTMFLLDSGADTTMLPFQMAKELGLYYNFSLKTQFIGIGKDRVTAYFGKIIVKIADLELTLRCYFANTKDAILLLGRLDLFDKFNITFKSSQKNIIFDTI